MISYGPGAGLREAGVAGGSPPESSGKKRIPEWLKNAFETERNPHRKRAIERMNDALHFLRTLAEFRERFGSPAILDENSPFLFTNLIKIDYVSDTALSFTSVG